MAMMMVVVAVMVPAMPTVMAVVPPMHFRRRQPGVFLNRCGGAGIAERQRIGALGRRCERQQGANGGEAQNFRELHGCSPWSGATSAPKGSPQRCTQFDAGDLNGS
jgi:hypothetical protein